MASIQGYLHDPPSYEEVMETYEYEHSMRLPGYQSRSLRRYHPYIRYTPTPKFEEFSFMRYMNTVYDEEYVELEVPRLPPRQSDPVGTSTSPGSFENLMDVPMADQSDIMPNPSPGLTPEQEHQGTVEADHIQRVYRLGSLISEFAAGVRRAMEGHDNMNNEATETTGDPNAHSTPEA